MCGSPPGSGGAAPAGPALTPAGRAGLFSDPQPESQSPDREKFPEVGGGGVAVGTSRRAIRCCRKSFAVGQARAVLRPTAKELWQQRMALGPRGFSPIDGNSG